MIATYARLQVRCVEDKRERRRCVSEQLDQAQCLVVVKCIVPDVEVLQGIYAAGNCIEKAN